ncbi:polyamine aminopropyltransferase [Candidatus Babeliales bacterium]|nr:polyamine aminopropyltransferase [Candidatus Babeliales bacterium]
MRKIAVYMLYFVAVSSRIFPIQETLLTIPSSENTLWHIQRSGNEKQTIFMENFELTRGATLAIEIEGDGPLEKVVSPFQTIEVYQTKPFGKMLVNDGVIMLTQYDNYAYHEMIAHVPLMSHPYPKRVLIVGGGDGGTLKEVLKHGCVEEVVLCEIDEEVINICKRHFPELTKAYNDPRVTIVIDDAAAYVATKKDYFDVICVDSTDPIGPGIVLFEVPFYENMRDALTEDGIAVAQGESMYYHRDAIKGWVDRNKSIFPISLYYYTVMPTYPSGTIGFLFCSKKYRPLEYTCEDWFEQRVKALPDLHYYTEDVHAASFMLLNAMSNVQKVDDLDILDIEWD